MDTMLLDRTPWDLCIDAQSNWAVASDDYSITQDVASACRLFAGELYYGGRSGVAYFTEALGRFRPTQLLKSDIVKAALTVPGVLTAQCFLTTGKDRAIGGQVQFTTAAGTFAVNI